MCMFCFASCVFTVFLVVRIFVYIAILRNVNRNAAIVIINLSMLQYLRYFSHHYSNSLHHCSAIILADSEMESRQTNQDSQKHN